MKNFLLQISILILLTGCFNDGLKKFEAINGAIAEVKNKYAPDKRIAVFDVKATMYKERVVLSGETDQPEALDALKEKLAAYNLENEVLSLPDESLKGFVYGIVNNSVSNIRSQPRHSSELATQATLGTELKVLKKEGEWYLVQTPDRYISWIDHGGLVVMDETNYDVWLQSEKVIFMESVGSVFDIPDLEGEVVSDVVMGCLLKLVGEAYGFYEVQYPDGRLGFIPTGHALKYSEWLAQLDQGHELLVENALKLKGLPYLWGGTSSKAVDCSGFTKTLYFMNGFIIPRDASQQVNEGMAVDEGMEFQGLEVGDLLFFGKPATDSTRQKTTHVGLWIGDGKFIHASRNVRISSVQPNTPLYDSANVNRYLGSKRYLNHLTEGIIDLKAKTVM